MSDYIKREDIIKWIDGSIEQCGNRYTTDMLNMMDMFKTVVNNCLPFADVVDRKLYMQALSDVIELSNVNAPFTNADRIRAMSDEGLANIIICQKQKKDCFPNIECDDCLLDWLKQEVKEE